MNPPFSILKRLLAFKPFALLASGCAHCPVNAPLTVVKPAVGYRFENAVNRCLVT